MGLLGEDLRGEDRPPERRSASAAPPGRWRRRGRGPGGADGSRSWLSLARHGFRRPRGGSAAGRAPGMSPTRRPWALRLSPPGRRPRTTPRAGHPLLEGAQLAQDGQVEAGLVAGDRGDVPGEQPPDARACRRPPPLRPPGGSSGAGGRSRPPRCASGGSSPSSGGRGRREPRSGRRGRRRRRRPLSTSAVTSPTIPSTSGAGGARRRARGRRPARWWPRRPRRRLRVRAGTGLVAHPARPLGGGELVRPARRLLRGHDRPRPHPARSPRGVPVGR